MAEFKVGDKVWIFDSNRRVYDGSGNFGGKVIYAEHFIQEEIVAETSRSWIVGHWKHKYPKNTCKGLYTDKQKAEMVWMDKHQYKIKMAVDRCRDAATLRKVADLVGYQEKE